MSGAGIATWLLEVDRWKASLVQLIESGDRARYLAVGDTVLANVDSESASPFR
jgi:hypothetical protein